MSDARGEGRGARRDGEARGARPVRRSLGEGGLDAAIDGAVREMLDVEPPPGLRGRVLDRIEATGSVPSAGLFTNPVASAWFLRNPVASAWFLRNPVASAFRRKALWLAVPVAAAAVILLAVLAPWRQAIEPAPSAPGEIAKASPRVAVPGVTLPQPAPATAPVTASVAARSSAPPRRAQSPARAGLVAAAAAPAAEDVAWIDSLSEPSAIDVAAIAPARTEPLRSIDLPPAQIPALDVRPLLSDTPRERRNQE